MNIQNFQDGKRKGEETEDYFKIQKLPIVTR